MNCTKSPFSNVVCSNIHLFITFSNLSSSFPPYLQHLFVSGVLAVLAAELLAEGLKLSAELDHSLCGRLVSSAQLSGAAAVI